MPKINMPPTGRDFFFSQGADNDDYSGLTEENPVSSPFEAAARAGAASPPPSDVLPVSVNGNSGSYIGELVLPEFANLTAPTVAIISNGAISIDCQGRQLAEVGAAINSAIGGICINLDAVSRVQAKSTTVVVGGDDGIGFNVTGACDDIFCELLSGTLTGERAIMFDHTATSTTPIGYRADVVEFFSDDQILMRFNPVSSSDQSFIDINTAQDGNGAVNSTGFHVMNGRLSIDAQVIEADCIVRIESGAQATLDIDIAVGSLELLAGSELVAKSVGLLAGDITVENGAHLDLYGTTLIGNITIDVGGVMDCHILSHIGTVTNNGTINGFINGDRYGKGNSESTTFTEGGVITQGALNTQVDITAGSGTIYDYSDPLNVGAFPVVWSAFDDVTITNVATELFSWFAIDRTGALVQFTPGGLGVAERRDYIIIGTVRHATGVFENSSSNYIAARETHAQLLDLLDCLGVINCTGFVITPNADLTFDKSAGVLMNPGAGNITNSRSENIANIIAESPTTFSRFLGITENSDTTGQTTVDPGFYDAGTGSPVSVPGGPNVSTIQYIFQFPTDGTVLLQYGQTTYATLDDAVLGAASDNPTIPQFIRDDALLVARIAIENTATDLSDSATSVFLSGAKFGVDISGGSGGSGAGGGDFFGPGVSATNEIVTFADTTGKIGTNASNVLAFDGTLRTTGSLMSMEDSAFAPGDNLFYPIADGDLGDFMRTSGVGVLTFTTNSYRLITASQSIEYDDKNIHIDSSAGDITLTLADNPRDGEEKVFWIGDNSNTIEVVSANPSFPLRPPTNVAEDNLQGAWTLNSDFLDRFTTGRDLTNQGSGGTFVPATINGNAVNAFDFEQTAFLEATASAYKGVIGTTTRSFTTWYQANATPTADENLVSWGSNDSGGGISWIVVFRGAASRLRVDIKNAWNEYDFADLITANLFDGSMHHIAITMSGTHVNNITLYIDGVVIPRTAADTFPNMNTKSEFDFTLGGSLTGTAPLNGLLYDARLFDKGLSQSEVDTIRNQDLTGGAVISGFPNNSVFAVTFNGSEWILGDAVGNAIQDLDSRTDTLESTTDQISSTTSTLIIDSTGLLAMDSVDSTFNINSPVGVSSSILLSEDAVTKGNFEYEPLTDNVTVGHATGVMRFGPGGRMAANGFPNPATDITLDVIGTTGTLGLPSLTTVQLTALVATSRDGCFAYDSTLGRPVFFTAGAWVTL